MAKQNPATLLGLALIPRPHVARRTRRCHACSQASKSVSLRKVRVVDDVRTEYRCSVLMLSVLTIAAASAGARPHEDCRQIQVEPGGPLPERRRVACREGEARGCRFRPSPPFRASSCRRRDPGECPRADGRARQGVVSALRLRRACWPTRTRATARIRACGRRWCSWPPSSARRPRMWSRRSCAPRRRRWRLSWPSEPRLKVHQFYLADIVRRAAHTLTENEEKILADAGPAGW